MTRMMRQRRTLLLAASSLIASLALPAAPRAQGAAAAGDVSATAAWTRAAGEGRTGAGFMTLRNAAAAPDRVVSASSPAARRVELHTHIREGDVMRMRPVPAIELPPGQEVRLAPGGQHLMMIGLTRPLRQGERVPVTLVLERGGRLEVTLDVLAAGARGPAAASAAHGHAPH
jgi:copper(I)-binding protein